MQKDVLKSYDIDSCQMVLLEAVRGAGVMSQCHDIYSCQWVLMEAIRCGKGHVEVL